MYILFYIIANFLIKCKIFRIMSGKTPKSCSCSALFHVLLSGLCSPNRLFDEHFQMQNVHGTKEMFAEVRS